ncbi:MAG: serine/threonine protein kinase [Acidobacteria bacterium]|jgi:serine/threonine protein kinase|nr:serine/threonine protein kinase [Acidobacteriota bacterium]
MFNSKSEVRFMNLDVDTNTHSVEEPGRLLIPGYEIGNKIGEGANGVVFKAIDKHNNRKVAIKILRTSSQKNAENKNRFMRELDILSRMSHPYIIQIYKVEKYERPYIIMEYLKYSLKNLLYDRKIKFNKIDALKIVRKLAQALEYAHANGIVHRDIKPSNILFRKNGNPVLADFGLVKSIHSRPDLTQPHSLLGTPMYMSPEQCQRKKADPLSDIYSLGVVLFELLSGAPPYKGETLHELLKQHTDPFIPVLPHEVKVYQPLIDGMMAKDKRNRNNATQVCAMVERFIRNTKEKPTGNTNKLVFFLLITAVIIFFIVVILMLFVI